MAYIYIVRCDDDSLYTGIATDIKKRIKNHVSGKGPSHAKYMRSRCPVEIAALWETDEYKVAAKLEYAIKKLDRRHKLFLTEKPDSVVEMFPNLSEFSFRVVKEMTIEKILSETSDKTSSNKD